MQIVDYGREFHVFIPFDHFFKRNVAAIKELSDRRWNPEKKVWVVPSSLRQNVEQLRYTHKAEIIVPENLKPEQTGEIAPMPELSIEIPWNEGVEPRPYQLQGIARSMELGRVLNGDEQGLGKSMQSIGTIVGLNSFPCLVICPASTKLNWKREVEKFTRKRAMVLDASMNAQQKRNWHQYVQHGFAEFVIVNYESLATFCVESFPNEKTRTGKRKPWHSKDVILKPFMSLFKSGILDESHRCFPYETKVLTDRGWYKIGDIVDGGLNDLLVASFNHLTNEIEFKPIKNVWRNPLGFRKICSLRVGACELVATEDHKIYTTAGRHQEISKIQSGENVLALRKEFLDEQSWQENSRLLLENLCNPCEMAQSGNAGANGKGAEDAVGTKGVRRVRKAIYAQSKRRNFKKNQVLHTKLLRQMANETAGGAGGSAFGRKTRKAQAGRTQANAGSEMADNAFQPHDTIQSDVQSGYGRKNAGQKAGTHVSFSRRQWIAHRTPKGAVRSASIARRANGTRYSNRSCERTISEPSNLLQGRYSNPRRDAGHRSRRGYASIEKVEVFGPAQNRSLECVRVDGNPVYQQRSVNEFTGSGYSDQIVYDLEIADNHNYFADGILVSNCKEDGINASKFVLRIFSGLEHRILLSGTPIVNKPKNLYPQLAILGHLNTFGGKKAFLDRYCEGGNGANNLKELNFLLNKHCFFRREKKDVAKDLPEKFRQTIVCDITTRRDYDKALKDLGAWLSEQGYTGEQIDRRLRGEVLTRIGALKQISARGKLNEVKEFAQEILDAGEKLVLFCNLYEIVNAVLAMFPGSVTVTGRDDTNQKQANIDRFQNDPACQLIVCNIQAAGVGITLTASSRVAFIEFPWTYAACVQAEDRCHRIGAKNNVMCTYFLGNDTIDEDLYEIIQSKRHVANTITGATDQMEMEEVNKVFDNLFKKQK